MTSTLKTYAQKSYATSFTGGSFQNYIHRKIIFYLNIFELSFLAKKCRKYDCRPCQVHFATFLTGKDQQEFIFGKVAN